MSLAANRAIIVYTSTALICASGPMPIVLIWDDGTRTDGVVLTDDQGISFFPFTGDEHRHLATAYRLMVTDWGERRQPSSVEVLVPNEDIVQAIEAAVPITEAHAKKLRDKSLMVVAAVTLEDFIRTSLAAFTDATHPPSWLDLRSRWRSEGHVARAHFREQVAESEERLDSLADVVGAAVTELQQKAATVGQVAELECKIAELETIVRQQADRLTQLEARQSDAPIQNQVACDAAVPQLREEMNAAQTTSTAREQELLDHITDMQARLAAAESRPPTASTEGNLNVMMAMAKAIDDKAAPIIMEGEFTSDIRTWGPLYQEYGSWPAVKGRLYRTLNIVPDAPKKPDFEGAFKAFDTWFDIVFSRWSSLDDLATPTNKDTIAALNTSLRRLFVAANTGQGLSPRFGGWPCDFRLGLNAVRPSAPFRGTAQVSVCTSARGTDAPNRLLCFPPRQGDGENGGGGRAAAATAK